MLIGESEFKKLNERLNYYVRKGKLLRPRKGIYANPDINPKSWPVRFTLHLISRLNMYCKRPALSFNMMNG
ncbi:MAG: type IV toxin-antitoxin system AbiEi family antitoxin domain-containing protein [Proteiniphilum sp.]